VGVLIDLFSSDLIAGYKEIVVARQAMLEKWRFELLRAYTKKRERYTQQLAQQEARKERYQGFLPFIGIALALVCSVGAWLTFRRFDLACLGMFLMLGSGFGALLSLLPWMGLSRTPPPPENPVSRTSGEEDENPLRQRLFPKLVPLWRRQMALRIPTQQEAEQIADDIGRWSLIGEFDLIRELERIASPETYILHGIQLAPDYDLNVIVVGPKGFWYFDVKHWNADITWQDGAWQIWQFDPETQSPQLITMREYPDAEWTRIRNEAITFLKNNAASLLKKVPAMGNIQGGIAFSDPHARVEIERSAPFRYGTIEQWIAVYQAAPRLKAMTPGRTLQLLEILLKRHQSFYPDAPRHSMKDVIAKVIAEVERSIQGWIDS
jgi:Nuclease-related domain